MKERAPFLPDDPAIISGETPEKEERDEEKTERGDSTYNSNPDTLTIFTDQFPNEIPLK